MCHCAAIFLKKDLSTLSGLPCYFGKLAVPLIFCYFGSRGGSGGSASGGNRASGASAPCPMGRGSRVGRGSRGVAMGRGGHGVAVGRGSHVGRGGHGWLWAGAAAWARVAMWAALFWVRCAHIPAQSLETANRCPARSRSTPTSVSSSCESQVKLTWALWPGPCVGDREAWALIRGLGRVPSICRLPCRGCSSAPCRHGTEVASWLSSLCPFKPAMVGRVLLTIQPL